MRRFVWFLFVNLETLRTTQHERSNYRSKHVETTSLWCIVSRRDFAMSTLFWSENSFNNKDVALLFRLFINNEVIIRMWYDFE